MNSLKLLREEKGWKQKELAQKLGVSKQIVNDWEKGRRFPSYLALCKLERIMRCSHADLFAPAAATAGDNAQDDYTAPAPRTGTDQAEAVQAAAELAEVSSSEMVRAALDFTDGRADTPAGRRVLDLMQTTAGAVM